MRKFLLFIMLTNLSAKNYAQTTTDKNTVSKDSIELLKDFMELMKSEPAKPPGYFTVGTGIGNRLFSVHNNALNSKQSSVNTLIYSPSVAYYDKSGFNITAGANLLNDSVTGFGVNQYSISPGYQLLSNDDIDFSIAYTHYFVVNKYSDYASPIQNDFYTAFTYKKTWLQPGVALDFSGGQYKEEKRKKVLYDSTNNKLKAFAFIASVAHEFDWDNVFTKKDGLVFTPSIMLNTGSNKVAIRHNTNATNLLDLLTKRGKLPKFQNSKFAAESAGIDLEASYVVGKITVEPGIYLDYYLPATDYNKVTTVFAVALSYKF